MGYKGERKGDSDRHSFAFFAVGAIVVIAVTFYLGLQVGRIVEKNAAADRRAESVAARATQGADNGARGLPEPDIRKEISSFSEDAVKIPAVPPAALPSAGEDLRRTEANVTAPETLSGKKPAPKLREGRAGRRGGPARSPAPARFTLQAGAMKHRGAADALKSRLEKAGYKASVVRGVSRTEGTVYRIRVGPFRTHREAVAAMKGIRTELKIDAILLKR